MSHKEKIKKYSTLLGGYGIGVLLNQGINLLLIPIFWRVLSPEDFGVIAISQIISLFLTPVYLFGASDTIQRFYYTWNEEERPHFLSWFFWFIFVFTLLLTVVLDFVGSHFSKHVILNVPFDPLLRYTLWSSFLANFINFPIAISRIKQKVLAYNFLVNGSFLTQIAIVYYLVKVENLGAYGYIKGFFIANCIWSVPIIFVTLYMTKFLPSRRHFFIPVRYAFPLGVSGTVEGLGFVLDRYFLDKFLPLATVGHYNLARQFGSIVNVINAVFKLIFIPYIYKINALKSHAAKLLGEIGLVYAALMTVPVVVVCSVAVEAVRLTDPRGLYLQLTDYVPAFALSFYFLSLTTVIGRGMDLAGRTKWIFLSPLSGLAASLAVYLTLLPDHGVWAILLGVLTGNLVRSIVHISFAVYFFPREIFAKKLLLSWTLSLAVFAVMRFIPNEQALVSLLIKLLLALALFAAQIKFIVLQNIKDILRVTKS